MDGVFSEYYRDRKTSESESQWCCIMDGCFVFRTVLGYRKSKLLNDKFKNKTLKQIQSRKMSSVNALSLPLPTDTTLESSVLSQAPSQNFIPPFSYFVLECML